MDDVYEAHGVWMEAGRYFVNVDQKGELFTATCSYRNDLGVDVKWHAAGSIGGNRLDCELVHDCPAGFSKQVRRATIVDDRIVGSVFVDDSMYGKFEWNKRGIIDMETLVPGHIWPGELQRLRSEASKLIETGGHIVEVGRLFGRSTLAMGYGLMTSGAKEKIFSIDIGGGALPNDALVDVDWEHLDPPLPDEMKDLSFGEIYEHYVAGVREHIVRIDGDSKYMLPKVLNGASLVFIDGDHTEKGFRSDLMLVLECKTLKTLICHDWVNNVHKDVRKVCDEVMGEPHELVHSMAIWNM